LGPPILSDDRLRLYQRHKDGRNLNVPGSKPIDAKGYAGFLVDRCVDAFEICFYLEGELIGVSITDRGANAISAVYCYFEPAHRRLSIGTYSILKQIELGRGWGLEYLYLGLYIRENPHMMYKAQFGPHERLIEGVWRPGIGTDFRNEAAAPHPPQ